MGGFGRCKGKLRLLGLLTTIAMGASAQSEAPGAEKRAPRVRIRDGAAAVAVERAIEQARRRLAEPECRRLFSDFTDASGRPLQAVLGESGQAPEDYVGELFFYDGSSHRRCGTGAVRAFTTPGSRAVFVCTTKFSLTAPRRYRGGYEFIVIHEMLHSLGLGEDPPSPSEINARVRARCSE